jgi:hypothetical protein
MDTGKERERLERERERERGWREMSSLSLLPIVPENLCSCPRGFNS